MRIFVLFLGLSVAAFGQRHKMESVNAEKPEGKLLQQLLQENDQTKKAALMEQYVTEFPKNEDTAWVLEELQGIYAKANDSDKTISAGERLLALDPDDPDAALQCLKAAEAKKDVAGVKKWAARTSANSRKIVNGAKPADEDAEHWKAQQDYAKQLDTYSEYALYSQAVQSRDPKVVIELAEVIQQQYPKGEYASKVAGPQFLAYRQAGANDKAIALAEKVLATDQSNEDMLLVVADNYLQNKKDPDKVHAYSAKIVEVMNGKAKPEGVSDADWSARKNLVVGLAHYMNGKLYYNETKFPMADTELRAALPLVDANPNIKPEVLYLLGFANYKIDKPQEAANYYRACAALKSPFQATAAKNLQGIKTQYTGVK